VANALSVWPASEYSWPKSPVRTTARPMEFVPMNADSWAISALVSDPPLVSTL